MSWSEWFKQKLTSAMVKDKQTDSPRSEQLHREFAEHPSKGLTPARLADILLAAERGDMIAQAELFLDMEEKDTHIAAELSKRKMAVKKLDWSLEAPRDATATEKKNTKILENLIRDELDVGAIRQDALDAIGHGYSCIELGWGRNLQDKWFPNQVEHRSPTWFTSPQNDRNTLHLRDSGTLYGVPLQPFGWIVHTHKSRSGYLARTGLHRVLAWPYLYKNFSARDMAEFLEIYGLPIRIGKYPASADDKAKRELMRSVLSIGHHAAGIIPESMQFELAQAVGSGNAESFKVMIDWCESSISKAILGGTLTSSTGANGNRSLGDVHNEVRLDIRDDDATQLDQTLSSHLVYPMAMLNGLFADHRCPAFVSDTQEPDDLELYSNALPKLVEMGMKIPSRYAHSKLKIPVPEGDEEILTVAAPVAPTAPPVPPVDSKQPAALAGDINTLKSTDGIASGMVAAKQPGQEDNPAQLSDKDPSPVSDMTDQLAAEAGGALKSMVDKISVIVDQAESLEALRDQLLDSYGDLDAKELTNVMALAFAAADLAGRFDVQNNQ